VIAVAKNESLSLFAAPRTPAPCPSLSGPVRWHSSFFGRMTGIFLIRVDLALTGVTSHGLRVRWDWVHWLFSNLTRTLLARDYF